MSELTLKWGTLKAWDFSDSEKGQALLKEYMEIGACLSAALQKDTERQKEIVRELIDECDDPEGIYLDWEGKFVTKQEAKEYIETYGRRRSVA